MWSFSLFLSCLSFMFFLFLFSSLFYLCPQFISLTFSIIHANSITHTYSHIHHPPVSYPPQTHTLLPKMHCPAARLPFHWPIKQPELYGSTDSKYINYRERERERRGDTKGEGVEKREYTWGLWSKLLLLEKREREWVSGSSVKREREMERKLRK